MSVSLEHVCLEVPCSCVRAFTNSRHTQVHTHTGRHTHVLDWLCGWLSWPMVIPVKLAERVRMVWGVRQGP